MNHYHGCVTNKLFYINYEQLDASLCSIFGKIFVLYYLLTIDELIPGLFGKLVVLYTLWTTALITSKALW